ncbi:MAG: hypothetical protein HKL80_03295 [Acidimicrobiales bacterium]|nr:hypothetical protein [Acidimicrobiales bacterium]
METSQSNGGDESIIVYMVTSSCVGSFNSSCYQYHYDTSSRLIKLLNSLDKGAVKHKYLVPVPGLGDSVPAPKGPLLPDPFRPGVPEPILVLGFSINFDFCSSGALL